MDQEKQKSLRTLLTSVLFSSAGPIILGLGLRVGHSSTQISDFTRRTVELLAIILALGVYIKTKISHCTEEQHIAIEQKGNRAIGFIMCISGLSMLLITFLPGEDDTGNVIPALIVAFLGVVANSLFWWRYTSLSKEYDNAILKVQARLYGAKSVVDLCVVAALAAVLAFPGTMVSYWMDKTGSVLVSLYMIRCGIKTINEQQS